MKLHLKIILSLKFTLVLSISTENDDWSFPENLLLGAATSAHQVEGYFNETKVHAIVDTGTCNCLYKAIDYDDNMLDDSYHKYKEDVAIVKDIGFNYYRFSISWTRLLPNGFNNTISEDGVRYYHNLIDEVKAKGLEPFVTINHVDIPSAFREFGLWANDLMIEWFVDYARIVFREFGHKVKLFITINGANFIGAVSTTGESTPGNYIGFHNMLRAHAKVYHMYHNEFRASQNGQIGIIFGCNYYFGENLTDTTESDVAFQYNCGWGAHPIFSKDGDYPKVMRDRIAENSEKQGFSKSKLPKFTQEEIEYIRGSADFFGLNHYASKIAVPQEKKDGLWVNDKGLTENDDPEWPKTENKIYRVVPEGMRGLLIKIKNEYNNPPVYILENGYADKENLEDYDRIKFYHAYMKQMLLAIKNGCNVKAYTVWTLIDNFEWGYGYSIRYGIVHVDFNDPNRIRTYKKSAEWFKDVLAARKLLPIDDYIQSQLENQDEPSSAPVLAGTGIILAAIVGASTSLSLG